MKNQTIPALIIGALFMGVLVLTPNAQANESPSIKDSCIFFNKIIFHLTEDLTTSSGFVLKKDHVREFILLGKYNTPVDVTQTLITGLCIDHPNDCIHNESNTRVDEVEFSADCADGRIRALTNSK